MKYLKAEDLIALYFCGRNSSYATVGQVKSYVNFLNNQLRNDNSDFTTFFTKGYYDECLDKHSTILIGNDNYISVISKENTNLTEVGENCTANKSKESLKELAKRVLKKFDKKDLIYLFKISKQYFDELDSHPIVYEG